MLNWPDIINHELQQHYMTETMSHVAQRRNQGITVFPPQEQVFAAFDLTPFEQVKVVMLGQDPYHGPGQAHGLCFSVQPGVAVPPSLKNMYQELSTDIEGFNIPNHGFLQSWAQQGVLMLNSTLTVESGKANSHQFLGWGQFTDVIIAKLNEQASGVVFLLWGSNAQKKGRYIDTNRHFVLKAPHPSPLSAYRGFFGCRHFSQTNQILMQQGKTPINWQV